MGNNEEVHSYREAVWSFDPKATCLHGLRNPSRTVYRSYAIDSKRVISAERVI